MPPIIPSPRRQPPRPSKQEQGRGGTRPSAVGDADRPPQSDGSKHNDTSLLSTAAAARPHLDPLCTRCVKGRGAAAQLPSSSRPSSDCRHHHGSGNPSVATTNATSTTAETAGASGPPVSSTAGGVVAPAKQVDAAAAAGAAPAAPSPAKYIINSRSFEEASSQLSAEHRAAALELEAAQAAARRRRSSINVPGGKTLFNRSSIVKQEILVGQSSLQDYYDLNVKNLGKGSYGSVVAARDLRTGTVRAVKIVYKPKIENITRLKREILIMKRLDHPNIIRLFEVFEDVLNLYLVMELCTGGELFDRIIKSGHFSERYAATIMRQILSAVAYCHANDVMHRDLKPENVLYTDQSPLSTLKVIDWGFAAKCTKNHKFSSVVGTPYYVAPEVLFGNYDKQCDLWSAGVILFILLSGFPPFHGKDNKEILRKVKVGDFQFEAKYWSKVSEHAKSLIRGLLTFEPRRRLTAVEALQHPWIRYYNETALTQDSPLTSKVGSDLLEKFRNFQRHIKLKKLALTVVAYQMTEKDIGALHEVFSALDKNADGVLSINEVAAGLANMNVKYGDEIVELLEELDTDGNGHIDYTEFIAASIDHKLYEQEAVCRAAFRVFDLDGDGHITIDEMKKVLELNFLQEAFSREMIEEMIKEVDTNSDGKVDFQEFMRMMRGNQKRKLENHSPFSRAKALLAKRLD